MAHWSNLVEFAELVADALMALCQLLESQGTNRDIVKKLHSYPAKGLAVRVDVKEDLHEMDQCQPELHHIYKPVSSGCLPQKGNGTA